MKKNTVTTEQIINENNKKFKSSSKAQKRVLIAQDVIDRINLKQYKASNGNWLSVYEAENYKEQFQTAVIENKVTCQCCALGGLMASCVVFKNDLTVEQTEYKSDYCDIFASEDDVIGIKGIFETKQLELIELAFEKGKGFYKLDSKENKEDVESGWLDERQIINLKKKPKAKDAIAFGKRFRSPKQRLLAIMENIVKNKGEFKPSV